jgi:hypothetical protein
VENAQLYEIEKKRGAMKHFTKDLAKRAEHIADKEAKKYYQKTGGDYYKKWIEVYELAFQELAGGGV